MFAKKSKNYSRIEKFSTLNTLYPINARFNSRLYGIYPTLNIQSNRAKNNKKFQTMQRNQRIIFESKNFQFSIFNTS